ncbi:MAG TPA: hypothetical protein VE010_01350 [Thermoanaerobaculia bacterium]|nr:hypothetical protein [Thermoanaerobaculia bacterium]
MTAPTLSPAAFTKSEIGWFCKLDDLEIVVPASDDGPDAAAIELASEFLSRREAAEASAQRWLAHHLKLPGTNELGVLEVLAQPDRHGASVLLTYFNSEDQYLWIDVGLHATVRSRFDPLYVLVKYY